MSDISRKVIAAAEVSEAEMAVRMLEAATQMKRPVGATAEQALAQIEARDREIWHRAARAALEYLSECLANAKGVH